MNSHSERYFTALCVQNYKALTYDIYTTLLSLHIVMTHGILQSQKYCVIKRATIFSLSGIELCDKNHRL